MSVKVALRVRPFNSREQQMQCLLCVSMKGQQTTLIDVGDPSKNRDFFFDYSFWSHDGFENDENGYSYPVSDRYADQQYVYNTVGKEILNNAWDGYHCCLFAYGQTGAGKSYSMVGYGPNKGIVPITCQQIFEKIKQNADPLITYEVQISMLEIYNEKVQDLLIPVNKRPASGLKVREHKVYGVYVEGLSKYTIDSYEAVEAKMEQGNRHRTIASTQMNASSSRAHTIIQIEFKSTTSNNQTKLSVLNLVDLAGSEKVGKTGATGDRLKEAGQINKSLSVLGQVISALAEKAMGKNKNSVVPYRDSSLTRILQNALGGNSKTLMICAISPANDNYDETLSTLRYADQAKKIKNNAVVNESESDRMIRELKSENEQLKQQLQEIQIRIQGDVGEKRDLQGLYRQAEIQQELIELQASLNQNDYLMNDALHHQDNILDESIMDIDFNVPHLVNLNEDPLLNGKINYQLDREITSIGRKNGNPVPQIVLNGVGIQPNHANIINKNGIYLEPLSKDLIYINGEEVKDVTQLNNGDRIIIGTSATFLMVLEGNQLDFDWEMAWEELETKRRKKIEAQMEKQLEEEIQRRMKEQNLQRREFEEEESMRRYRIKERAYMESRLSKYLPLLLECNLIAKELQKNVKFQPKLKYVYAEQFDFFMDFNEEDAGKGQLKIEVQNEDNVYQWNLSKFQNRYFMIKSLLEDYYETGILPKLSQEADPFWDPPEGKFIGQAFLKMESLLYLMDCPSELALVGENLDNGWLFADLIPCDKEGIRNLSQDIDDGIMDEIEDPSDLLNGRLDFKVVIQKVDISEFPCKDIYVEYSIQNEKKKKLKQFQTQKLQGVWKEGEFNYSKQHTYEVVNQEIIDYLSSATICFEMYGFELQQNMNQNKEDKDLIMRRKRSTLSQQPRKSTLTQNRARGQSRQILREKMNSIQIMNAGEMRRTTISKKPNAQQEQEKKLQQQREQQKQKQKEEEELRQKQLEQQIAKKKQQEEIMKQTQEQFKKQQQKPKSKNQKKKEDCSLQ